MSFLNLLRIRTYWYGLLALLLLPRAGGQIAFTSKYGGNTVTGLVGSSVRFTWSFTGDVNSVDWGLKKAGVNAIENNGVLVSLDKNDSLLVTVSSVYSGRVSGSGDVSSGHVIFTLTSIRRSDKGFYGCIIKPTDFFDLQKFDSVYLAVKEASKISFSSVQSSYNEGSAVSITCTASGIPDPDVQWYRSGTVKSSGKKAAFLTFSRIHRTDDGQYTCRANNSAGSDEKHITLVVHYPPTIKQAAASADKSWIGQTVTLKCVSDGVPTPTLTWYKPDGSRINSVTATQNTVNVKMSVDPDFGGFKCNADNGLTPADFEIVKLEQIKKPGSPTIAQLYIQSTSLTVKWTAPADDGGIPITAYRAVILKGSTEIKNEDITDPGTTSWTVRGLEIYTNYMLKILARNAVFEGTAVEKAIKTKYEGVPASATINDLPNEVTDNTITLKWDEPQNNGRVITQYTVYQRIVTDGKPGEWIKLTTITDVSVRQLQVELKKGEVNEFVVTATNEFGESLIEDGKITRVKAIGVSPTITKKSKSKVIVVEENVLYLVCQAEGYPTPSVTWRKNGKVLQSNISKTDFIIDDTSEKDAGKYECEASNSVGTVSYTVEVTIKGSSCNETTLHIIYIIVILVLLIIILILIIVQRRQRNGAVTSNTNRRKKCAECGGEFVVLNPLAVKPDQQSSSNKASGDSATYAAPTRGDYMPLHPSGRTWEINREQVKITKVVGKGAFSRVAKATAWNVSGNEEHTTVAVKMLKANAPESDRRALLSELELMKKLKPHPHVIKLIGCVTVSDPLLVLIEYVPYGDLLGYLRKSRGLDDTYFKDPDVKTQTSLTSEQLMRFAWQVADGMLYLSSRKVHRVTRQLFTLFISLSSSCC